jgi:hypothetical protein
MLSLGSMYISTVILSTCQLSSGSILRLSLGCNL